MSPKVPEFAVRYPAFDKPSLHAERRELILVKFYSPTSSEPLECQDCGWQGSVELPQLQAVNGSRDYRCPCCQRMLAMVSDTDAVRSDAPMFL